MRVGLALEVGPLSATMMNDGGRGYARDERESRGCQHVSPRAAVRGECVPEAEPEKTLRFSASSETTKTNTP